MDLLAHIEAKSARRGRAWVQVIATSWASVRAVTEMNLPVSVEAVDIAGLDGNMSSLAVDIAR